MSTDSLSQENLDPLSVFNDPFDENQIDIDHESLDGFGEIDVDVSFPHIRVKTSDINRFLRGAVLLANSVGRDVISRSVSFVISGDFLVARSTDLDSFLEYSLPIQNFENRVASVPHGWTVQLDVLLKLVKAAATNIIFFLVDDKLQVRLACGDIGVEVLGVSADKFTCGGDFSVTADVQATSMFDVLKALSPIALSASTPTERRIYVRDGVAFSSHLWSAVSHVTELPDCEIQAKDSLILRFLLNGAVGNVQVSESTGSLPRVCYSSSQFKYFTIKSNLSSQNSLFNQLASIPSSGIYLDLRQFFKTVTLSSDLPYSIGKFGVNYSSTGIIFTIKTKQSVDSAFNLSGSHEGQTSPLSKEVVLQAKLVKLLLQSFRSSASVKVSLTKDGFYFSSESINAACFVER